MGVEIRLPQINSNTNKGQLTQIKSYLYQLAEQLNWALANVDDTAGTSDNFVQSGSAITSFSNYSPEDAQAANTFNSIKGLIIKSADIVDAFYEEISKKLIGQYVAQSEYGTFKEATEATLTATSKALEIKFTNGQEIDADGNTIEYTAIRSTDAWAKVGILDYENSFPIYGMEIGQYDTDGTQTEKKYARYTSSGVYLYDESGVEVVEISKEVLRITKAEISKSLSLGGYIINVESNDGIVFKWQGGGQ